jgi:hypothetical protein
MSKIAIPNGTLAVTANYKEQVIEEYKGNPFIEALPLIYSSSEAAEKLAFYPIYNNEERMLESQYRIHLVQRLFQCFQPLPIHLDLESRISRVLRQGYLARNPFKPEYIEALRGSDEVIKNMNYELCVNDCFRTSSAGFTIIGASGMGKTTAVNRVLSTISQVIVHSEYKGMNFSMYQLTWLKLDCPFDGSLKGLCIDFFRKVDSLIGTNYYYKFNKKTIDNMLSVMSQIAKNTGLGLLVIDEIQHLSEAKNGGSEKMLNFFVTLVNTIGVPTILIGTTKALSILQSEFRQARRGSGQGDMIWDRLKKDDNWDLLIKGLWSYQWTKKETPLTDEIDNALYEESQGIIDIAVKLYAMSQIRAIISGKEEVTSNLIERVSKENLRLVHPMLEALKSGDIKRIANFEDICTADIDFEEYMNRGKQRLDMDLQLKEWQKQKKENIRKPKLSKKEQTILKLLDLGIGAKKVQKAVNTVFENEDDKIEVADAIIKAIQMLNAIGNKQIKKKKIEMMKNENDLRSIVDEGRKNNMTAYEALRLKGIIKIYDNEPFKEGVV